MVGVEANAYELAWLVVEVEAEAAKCAAAPCAWVGPVGGYLACLMGYVVSSYVGDEGADVGSMCFEPFVACDMKPYEADYEQEECACEGQVEYDDGRIHGCFLSRASGCQLRMWILMLMRQGLKIGKAGLYVGYYNVFLRLMEVDLSIALHPLGD